MLRATGSFGRENDQSLVDAPDIYFEAGDHQALVHVWQRVSQVNGQRAARPDQPSRVAIEQSKGIRRALRVEAVQMHSVLIVATVDRGHGDSVGRLMRRWAQSAEQPTLLSRGRRTARRP